MDIGNRIRHARELRKMERKELAPLIKRSVSAISNWENGINNPGRRSMEKLANALGVSAQWLEFGEEAGKAPPSAKKVQRVNVVGAVEAGVWQNAVGWSSDQRYELIVPQLPSEYANAFALEVRGPSMNLHYPDGSYVICVRLLDLHRDIRNGDHVVVYRQGPDDLLEATIKELVIGEDNNAWLWPRSNHPDHTQPLPIKDDQEKTVEIHAVVIAHFSWRF